MKSQKTNFVEACHKNDEYHIVCSRSSDSTISLSRPLIVDTDVKSISASRDQPSNERQNIGIAAHIIYEFIEHQKSGGGKESVGPFGNINKCIPAILLEVEQRWFKLSRDFGIEVISSLPKGEGTITGHFIKKWLYHRIQAEDRYPTDDVFDENRDLYIDGKRVENEFYPFESYGLVCRRNNANEPLCNIDQRAGSGADVLMDWQGALSARLSLAECTLNIFYDIFKDRLKFHQDSSELPHGLYPQFAADFLADMPAPGGQIPISVIGGWCESKRSSVPVL